MAKQRIGLLGGTFDPIHFGHLLLAVHSYEELNLDRVMFIPSRQPPHKSETVAKATDRLEMVRLALADDARFLVCDCELGRSEPSYTIDTVGQLQSSLGPDAHLLWLIGSDMVADLPSWHKISELLELIEIVVVGRAGQTEPNYSLLEPTLTAQQIGRIRTQSINLPLIDISSTMIRKRIAAGQSVHYMLPTAVEEYITKHKLYQPKKTEPVSMGGEYSGPTPSPKGSGLRGNLQHRSG